MRWLFCVFLFLEVLCRESSLGGPFLRPPFFRASATFLSASCWRFSSVLAHVICRDYWLSILCFFFFPAFFFFSSRGPEGRLVLLLFLFFLFFYPPPQRLGILACAFAFGLRASAHWAHPSFLFFFFFTPLARVSSLFSFFFEESVLEVSWFCFLITRVLGSA